MEEIKANHVKAISIKKLFGTYSYQIPDKGYLSELAIIYADNGAGKTNLLRLIFQMLSAATDKGYRNSISQTVFSELEITLTNNITLRAKKQQGLLTGPTAFEIFHGKSSLAKWLFVPGESVSKYAIDGGIDKEALQRLPAQVRKQLEQDVAKRNFFNELKKLNVSCSILTPDRMLMGEEPGRSDFESNVMSEVRRGNLAEALFKTRVATLERALESTSNWARRQAFKSAYTGGDSVNSVYQGVVMRILTTPFKVTGGLTKIQQQKIVKDIADRLKVLEGQYERLSEYGFAPKIQINEIVDAVKNAPKNKIDLINSVIEPYLNSLDARVAALNSIYEIVSSFIKNINTFLKDKRLVFQSAHGFKIISSFNGQPLQVSQLSSGEQQLLTMFCHVLAARDSSTVFIIDEPEISLNIKWQRILVTSLLDIAKGSGIQLIFASHSFEILARHKAKVVSLENLSSVSESPVEVGDEE